MRLALLAFVAGSWWLQQLPALPPVWLAAGIPLAVLAAFASRCRYPWVAKCSWIVCACLCGFCWAAWRADVRLAEQLAPEWEGQDIVVKGAVASLPSRLERGVRFQFDVMASDPPNAVPSKIALTWYENDPPVPGEQWQLRVRLRRPHGTANPYTFDYEYWLLEQGIRASGYVRAGPDNQRLPDGDMRASWQIERWRDAVRRHLLAAAPEGGRYNGVLVALVIGDQRGIPAADWQMFTRTGIGHLISISGLHITMIASLFAAIAMWLWRHSFGLARWLRAPLPLRLPAQHVAALAGVLAAFVYCLLAGMQVPAQRTLIMLAVVALAYLCGRSGTPVHVLAWAAALVTLIDPWAVQSAGFWLSFGAVAVIFLSNHVRRAPHQGMAPPWGLHRLLPAARLQWAITVGLVPLTLLLFQQVSVASPLANAIAIPVVSFIVTPLALLGAALPMPSAMWVLWLAHTVMAGLGFGLEWIAGQSWAVWQAAHPPLWAFLSGTVGVGLLLAPGGLPSWALRVHACVLLLPLCFARAPRPGHGEFFLTALDVGQGTAVVLETARHRLLYDTGPAYGSGSGAGDRVIVPYLRGLGAGRLDRVVISHEDSDHTGGAAAVLDAVPVSTFQAALPADHSLWGHAALRKAAVRVCHVGDSWVWDGVRFEMLHPAREDAQRPDIASNARSCVLRISNGHHTALLTGDIGVAQEAAITSRMPPDKLLANILLVPHHGSATSSGSDFLRSVAPALAIFQMGYRNRYGHPQRDVWARYERLGIARLRSDDDGAVAVKTNGPLLHVEAWREAHARYWRAR